MEERGKKLERLLTEAFRNLQEAEEIVEHKVNIEFLFTIVGSYITANDDGKLSDDVRTPAELFEERIFPIVDGSTLEVEDIEEDEEVEEDG
jgi:hypothetical protein